MTEPTQLPPRPRDPIIVPRWMLVTMYSGFIVLGIVAAIAGIPTLDLKTPDGFITPYAIAIATAGCIAVIGATSRRRELLEMFGACLLFCLLSAYAAAASQYFLAGDLRRGTFSIVVLMVTFAPAAQGVSLLYRLIRRRTSRRRPRA